MIKNTKLQNEIVSVKLSSGEEVIAKLMVLHSEYAVLHKPVCLVPAEQGLSFAPFMMTTADDVFEVSTNLIVAIAKTISELEKNYIQTTTGIIT